MSALPCRETVNGLEVFLRVTPKASANRVQGIVDSGGGILRLKIQVTAAPENGKANAAVIKLLSKIWRVPKSDISIVSGQTDRNKTLLVPNDPSVRSAVMTALSAI